MSNSTKSGGQSSKKNRESCERTSEKKLVQARLPFKVLAGGASTSTELKAAASLTKAEIENDAIVTDARKRRLSFESDIEVHGTTNNHQHNLSKENVNTSSPSKRSNTLIIKSEEILSIEGSQGNLSLKSNEKSALIHTPKGHSSKKRINVTTPQSVKVQMGKSNRSPKLQIKLLLSGGKKSTKRKLKTRLEGSSKSDANEEIEVVSSLNPRKKAKIDNKEGDTFVKTETELKENIIELDSEFEDLNKDKEDSENVEADDERDDADVSQNGKVLICGNEEEAKIESLNNVAVLEDSIGISTNIMNKNKDLTTKQKKLVEQRRKAREEKERKLQDEKRRKQEEKDEKEQKKRKEREEKEEQKRKERDEKERRRLADINAKNEEKRKRNEAKEEELRKKEEERKRKEQEKEEFELKKKKAAEAFTKFFLPKASISNPGTSLTYSDNNIVKILAFQPFEIKGDMKMAPVFRKILTAESRERLDSLQRTKECSPEDRLYLATLRSGEVLPKDELDKVGEAIIEEGLMHGRERMRAKFYKFHDNRRPPYYGTWRKKSTVVKPRTPFNEDKKIFDYEADSDEEWEEEEPGESLDGSEDDKDRESEDDDYEVDNKWFVPHGHLSEEEMQNEDEWMAADDNTRQAQKFKLQLLQQEFSQQMKKKTEKIKPRLIGCIWVDENGNQPENCVKIIWDSLQIRTMLCNESIVIEAQLPEIERSEPLSPMAVTVEKLKPISLSEEMVKNLARLIHGNKHSKNFLINEYIAYVERTEEAVRNGDLRKPLKSMVRDKIDEIAAWKAMETIESTQDSVSASNNSHKNKKKKIKKKLCWVVAQAVLDKMGLQHLDLKNGWNYTLVPKLKNTHETTTITQLNENTSLPDGNNEDGEARQRHGKYQTLQVKLKGQSLKQTVAEKIKQQTSEKKRVPLVMGTPRPQNISAAAKNNLISQFLQKATNPKSSNKLNTMLTPDSLDKNGEIVVLD
uniref:Chromatin assembly factor 1 subunit p150 C-terminal domain-containing protein n=1 Tax=Glossina austeni TaxID=7395 RepID=A0A1A9VDL1_GLOAU